MKTTSRLSNVIMCAGLAQLSDARSHYPPHPTPLSLLQTHLKNRVASLSNLRSQNRAFRRSSQMLELSSARSRLDVVT